MRSTSLRVRAAAIAAAVALPFAGLLAAAPAQAVEVPAPVIELDVTEFPAGDWGTGFRITGTGFVGTGAVTVYVGVNGPNGGGALYSTDVAPAPDGSIDAEVVPTGSTEVPDAEGYPIYTVSAGQKLDETTWLNSNRVELTITPGASVTAPDEVSPEQVTAGFNATFAGYAPGEPIFFYFDLRRAGDFIDTFEGETTADAEGNGTVTGAIAGAQIGDVIEIYVLGAESERAVSAWVQVVEAPAPAPAPAPAGSTPAATGPKLAETGVDLTVGALAAGLLVLGVAGVVVRRRFATR